jgi:GxxExxY protein
MDIEIVAREIVDAAIHVHTRLGPGMLESAYEACMELELAKRALSVKKQVPLPLRYDDRTVDIGYRLDMLVEEAVVIEIKSVAQLLPIHTAQVLSYLRAGDYRIGFLLNFNTVHMRSGIKRLVNQLPVSPPTLAFSDDVSDLGV